MERRLPIAEAKAHFAECIRRVESGEAIVLTRHGRPVARLAGLEAGAVSPALGDSSEDWARLPAAPEGRREALERLLEEEIWPRVPEELLDKGISKREREEILGLGEGGV